MFVVVQTRTYGAHVPVEDRASYTCESCGHGLHALAQAEGLGLSTAGFDLVGGSLNHQSEAQSMAHRNAASHLRRAFELAICPMCAQPPAAAARDMAERKARWKKRRTTLLAVPLPVALAAAGLAALFSRYVAESSTKLLVCAVAFAVAVPAVTVAALSRPQPGVYAPNARIYFWRTDLPPDPYRTHDGQGRWVEAPFAVHPQFGSPIVTIGAAFVTVAALFAAFMTIAPN